MFVVWMKNSFATRLFIHGGTSIFKNLTECHFQTCKLNLEVMAVMETKFQPCHKMLTMEGKGGCHVTLCAPPSLLIGVSV